MKITTGNKFLKNILFFSILVFGLFYGGRVGLTTAQASTGVDGIKTLKANKIYSYDLNGDGTADKIQYKVTVNEEKYTVSLKLYINSKLCVFRKDAGYTYTIQLLDLDSTDNCLDLYGYATSESNCISHSFFATYDEQNQYHGIKFSPEKLLNQFSVNRYSIGTLDGDGKFELLMDTPFYSASVGCYYCYVPFQLKNYVVSAISTNTFDFNKSSASYSYQAAKSFTVYKKAGSKVTSYTVKKGNKITCNQLYVTKTGKAYFRLVNSKGKTGWISAARKNLFVEYPAWG